LQHLLPEPYSRILEPLMNECPVTPYDEVYRFMEREYKDISLDPKNIFEKIDSNPIGSASIAQVHKGYLKDGTPVAIKVKIKLKIIEI
jgi:ubiquinone biosynthesis protein